MKLKIVPFALVASLLMSNFAIAGDGTGAAASAPAAKSAKQSASKVKKVTPQKLVDINSASSAELKKLPGITAEDAAKIIAGRPYGSKTWLVTNKVLTEDKFPAIRGLVVAGNPTQALKKNAVPSKK
jgi:hypothetical protein